jgi:uncharacterized repeat protein (TIGR03803 family)
MQSYLSAVLRAPSLAIVILGWTLLGWAQGGESPIYNFGNDASHGIFPDSNVVFDQQSNLYGTTPSGGFTGPPCNNIAGCGTVFEITPLGPGTWALSNYYVFSGGADGSFPDGGVILDAAGNIYGTTVQGGAFGYGTVFELTPINGVWIFNVLHSFNNVTGDFGNPKGRLVMDKNGNIYGTSGFSVWELKRTKAGWRYGIIDDFHGRGDLSAGLFIRNGVLFGTSAEQGANICINSGGFNAGCGFVFQLKRSKGVWKDTTIYNFVGAPNDGSYPNGKLIADSGGNLYGTTEYGGSGTCTGGFLIGCGTLFELSPRKGSWRIQVLHNFAGGTTDGAYPASEPIFDSSHGLLGTAWNGGSGGNGVIYKLSPSPPYWTIASFSGGNDGAVPLGPLSFDSFGFLYGTTARGGFYGQGTVFTLLP